MNNSIFEEKRNSFQSVYVNEVWKTIKFSVLIRSTEYDEKYMKGATQNCESVQRRASIVHFKQL